MNTCRICNSRIKQGSITEDPTVCEDCDAAQLLAFDYEIDHPRVNLTVRVNDEEE